METTDDIIEIEETVLSHQKRGDQHRLIICHYPPPQEAGEWVNKDQFATVGNFSITWHYQEYRTIAHGGRVKLDPV